MKVRSYEQVIDKSIMEVKMYLLMHSQGYYQQDIHDMSLNLDTCRIEICNLQRLFSTGLSSHRGNEQ